mgnify:FL=1
MKPEIQAITSDIPLKNLSDSFALSVLSWLADNLSRNTPLGGNCYLSPVEKINYFLRNTDSVRDSLKQTVDELQNLINETNISWHNANPEGRSGGGDEDCFGYSGPYTTWITDDQKREMKTLETRKAKRVRDKIRLQSEFWANHFWQPDKNRLQLYDTIAAIIRKQL